MAVHTPKTEFRTPNQVYPTPIPRFHTPKMAVQTPITVVLWRFYDKMNGTSGAVPKLWMGQFISCFQPRRLTVSVRGGRVATIAKISIYSISARVGPSQILGKIFNTTPKVNQCLILINRQLLG